MACGGQREVPRHLRAPLVRVLPARPVLLDQLPAELLRRQAPALLPSRSPRLVAPKRYTCSADGTLPDVSRETLQHANGMSVATCARVVGSGHAAVDLPLATPLATPSFRLDRQVAPTYPPSPCHHPGPTALALRGARRTPSHVAIPHLHTWQPADSLGGGSALWDPNRRFIPERRPARCAVTVEARRAIGEVGARSDAPSVDRSLGAALL